MMIIVKFICIFLLCHLSFYFPQILTQWSVVVSVTIVSKQSKNYIKLHSQFRYTPAWKISVSPLHQISKHQTQEQKQGSANRGGGSDTAYAAPALTKTPAPNPAATAAHGIGKGNSNRAQPTDGQTSSPSTTVDQDSDILSVASIAESDGDLDYVKSAKNSLTIPANSPDLVGHINELEENSRGLRRWACRTCTTNGAVILHWWAWNFRAW